MSRNPELDYQRQLSALLLDVLAEDGFALAGSGAIREHGLTNRPTFDIDVFATATLEPAAFADATERAITALEAADHQVVRRRSSQFFTRILVIDSERQLAVDVDFAIDWRREPPSQCELGPVLSLHDAIAGKLSAVYSRGEARDFLDLDAIRVAGVVTDSELLDLLAAHDPGFDAKIFARQVAAVTRLTPIAVSEYGVSDDELRAIQQRLFSWAAQIDGSQRPSAPPAPTLIVGPEPPTNTPYLGL